MPNEAPGAGCPSLVDPSADPDLALPLLALPGLPKANDEGGAVPLEPEATGCAMAGLEGSDRRLARGIPDVNVALGGERIRSVGKETP